MSLCLPLNSELKHLRRVYLPVHTVALLITLPCISYLQPSWKDHLAIYIPPSDETRWWTFFSASLVHSDSAHLWSNMVPLMTLGLLVEILHGTLPAALVFWLGGTTGTLMESVWWVPEPNVQTRLLGSSGGVFALVAAQLAHLLLNWGQVAFRVTYLVGVLCYIALLIALAALDDGYSVAHAAHWFAFVQGLFIGLIALQNVRVLPWEVVLIASASILACALLLSAFLKCAML